MPQSLRSILGKSNRVKKPSRPSPSPSPSPQKRSQTQTQSPSPRKRPSKPKEETKEIFFDEQLDDVGAANLLAEDLTLRDVPQAMRYIRAHMFSPVPERGFTSTRTTELLNQRAVFPGIVTMGHLHAILDSPTMIEREVAELISKGVLRKVRIARRGGMGEALIETEGYEAMMDKANIEEETKAKYKKYLRENPSAQTIPEGVLPNDQADSLIRLGYLTTHFQNDPFSTLNIRPEDRTTLTSIQRISKHASGSLSAVGGSNVIHLSGGGSGAPTLTHSTSQTQDLKIAIPGHGRYLKLAAAGVEWVREMLGRTKWGECPESWLKERFEGGGLYGPRWKDFWGVEWAWVLGEAVGLGMVEVFETRSVGKGVRALGG